MICHRALLHYRASFESKLLFIMLTAALAMVLTGTSACSSHAGSKSSTSSNASSSESNSSSAADSGPSSGGSQDDTNAGQTISRDDAISDHWDDIKEYVTGSETVDACSSESGSCYTLDADIDKGEITEIHFNNGGHLSFSAEINDSGSASDSDENGNSWDFTLDMNSSIVDNAIDDWAKAKEYDVQ